MSSSEMMMGNDDNISPASPEEEGDDDNNNNNNNIGDDDNQNINNINNDDLEEEDNNNTETNTTTNNVVADDDANASSDGGDDGNDNDDDDGNNNNINNINNNNNINNINSSSNDNHNAAIPTNNDNAVADDDNDDNDDDGSKNNDNDDDEGDNENNENNINADAASGIASNADDDNGKCNENDGDTTMQQADDDDDDDGDGGNIDDPTKTLRINSNNTENNNDERDESSNNNKTRSRRSSRSNNNNNNMKDKDKISIKNELNKRRKFHCIRCCGSLQGSAVFTNWDDCQMMISSTATKHNDDGDNNDDSNERPLPQQQQQQQKKTPQKKKYEYKSFDDWDDAYQFLYPRKKKKVASSSSPGTSNSSKKQASYNTTSSSKATTSTGTGRSSNSRSNSNNRKRSIDQVSSRKDDEEEEEEEDPTSNYAKAYPPEGPIIDPDSIELPIMIQGAQGQTPKQELNDWHLGRKLSFFNKNFDERMTEMSQYLDEFDGNFFVGRRNKNNKNHPQYKPLLNWIDNTLRPQLKVYTTLKETRGTVPVDILPKHHGYSRFILFMKRSHIERMKGVGIYDSLMMEAKERRAMVKAKVQESKEPQVWDQMYEDLQKFKDKWGHVIVRREECVKDKQPGHSKLVNWVDRQRQEYRKLQQGDPESTMTNDRIVKLSELGVVLDSKPMQSFDDRAREWLIYKATHNGEDPPPSKTKNNGLHLWIVKTRQKYAKLQAGEKTTLTQEQADQLASWGFNFEIKKPRASSNNGTGQQPKRSWEDRLQDYINFKAEYGTAWITKNSCALGQWCADQRKNYNVYKANLKNNGGNESSAATSKGPMTAEKIAKLEAAGFPWEKPGDNDIVFDSRQAKRQKLQQDRQRHLMEIEAMEPSLRQEAATDVISTRPRNPESTIAPAATTRDGENVDTNTTTNDETMEQQQHQQQHHQDNDNSNDNINDNTASPAVTILYPPPPPPTHPPMGGVHPHHHHPQYHPHPHAPPMHPHPPPLPPPYQQQDPYHMHHHQNGGGDGGANSNNGGQQGQAQDQQQQQQYGNNNNDDGGQEQQQQQQQQQFPRFGKYPWGFGSM